MQTRSKRNFRNNNVINKNDYDQIIKSSVKIPKTPTRKVATVKKSLSKPSSKKLGEQAPLTSPKSPKQTKKEKKNQPSSINSENDTPMLSGRNSSISSRSKRTLIKKEDSDDDDSEDEIENLDSSKKKVLEVKNKKINEISITPTIKSITSRRRVKQQTSINKSKVPSPLVITRRSTLTPIVPPKNTVSPKKRKHLDNEKEEEESEKDRKEYLDSLQNNENSKDNSKSLKKIKEKQEKEKEQEQEEDEDSNMIDTESIASSFEDEFDDFENGFNNIKSIEVCKHLSNIKFEKPRKKLFDPNFWKCQDCSSTSNTTTSTTIDTTITNSNNNNNTHPSPPTTQSTSNLFICLTCGFISCASSKKKHLTSHFNSTSHPLFLDINSKFCYCFNCNAFIENDNSKNQIEILRQVSYNSNFNLLKSRFDSNEKMIQDDIVETALNHFEMSLTRKFFNIWKTIVRIHKSNNTGDQKLQLQNTKVVIQDYTGTPPSSPSKSKSKIISKQHAKQAMVPIDSSIATDESLPTTTTSPDNFIIRSNIKSRISKKPLAPSNSKPPLPIAFPSSESESEISNGSHETPSTPQKTSNRNYSSTYLMSKVASSPVKQNKIIPGVTGLRNLGNTCFMNTILQALSNIPEFRTFFVEYLSEDDTIISNNLNMKFRQSTFDCLNIMQKKGSSDHTDEDLSFTKQLSSLFRLLWAGRWTVVTPHLILESVWKHIPKFKTYQQQDAQEFLSYLLDHIAGELNPKLKLPPSINTKNTDTIDSKHFRSFSSRKKKKLSLETNSILCEINDFIIPPTIPITLNSSSNNILINPNDNINLTSLESSSKENSQQDIIDQQITPPTSTSPTSTIESDQKPPSTPPDTSSIHKDRYVPEPMLIEINQNNNNNNNKQQNEKEIQEKEKEKETIVSKIFQGKLKSEIICLNCNNNVSRIEPFLELTLDIPFIPPKPRKGRKKNNTPTPTPTTTNNTNEFNLIDNKCSLEDCIKMLVKQEDLSGKIYQCEHCESKQNAKKKFSIETLPNVLCIVLKRFSYQHHYGSKISTQVRFPFELNLSDFVKSNNNNSEYNYELLNVINHHGAGLTSGHYTAYCFNDKQEIWVHYNDTKTTIVEAQDVIEDSQSNAYILFYQRSDLKKKEIN